MTADRWKLAGCAGQHDEEGYAVRTEDDNYFLFTTPPIYTFSRMLGVSHHDPKAWQAYHDFAKRIVADHNERPDLERLAALALEMRGALSAGVGDAAFLRDWCGRLDDAAKAGRQAGE